MTSRPATGHGLGALTLACAVLAAAGTARGQDEDGAESEVNIVKGDQIQITKVDDILVGVFTRDATLDARTFRTDQFDYQCVYSTTGTYRLDVTSANAGSVRTDGFEPAQFQLENDAGDRMDYEVHLWYRPVGGNFQDRSTRYTDPPISVPNLSSSRSPTCADEGLGNSNQIVTGVVNSEPFNAAPPGIYRDVLTITVSIE